MEILFQPNQKGESPQINSLEDAVAVAWKYLTERGDDPWSGEGQKFLTQVISSARQFFEGFPPLPGTRSNEEIFAEMQSRKKLPLD